MVYFILCVECIACGFPRPDGEGDGGWGRGGSGVCALAISPGIPGSIRLRVSLSALCGADTRAHPSGWLSAIAKAIAAQGETSPTPNTSNVMNPGLSTGWQIRWRGGSRRKLRFFRATPWGRGASACRPGSRGGMGRYTGRASRGAGHRERPDFAGLRAF